MNKFYQNLKISLPSCKDVEKKKSYDTATLYGDKCNDQRRSRQVNLPDGERWGFEFHFSSFLLKAWTSLASRNCPGSKRSNEALPLTSLLYPSYFMPAKRSDE